MDDLRADITTLQWVVSGYLLAQAAVIPLAGWLGDRLGMRRLYLGALAVFVLGSALCALAPGDYALIACRVLQGLGGGLLLPLGMAYVFRLSPPERRGMVMGAFGLPILFAPAIGPTVAGLLVQYADWRWVFALNLPLGALALWLGWRRLPASAPRPGEPLDLPGLLLGPLAFVLLLLRPHRDGLRLGSRPGAGRPGRRGCWRWRPSSRRSCAARTRSWNCGCSARGTSPWRSRPSGWARWRCSAAPS